LTSVGIAFLASFVVLPGSASNSSADFPALLPDLVTLPPESFSIVSAGHGKKMEKRLRFDNEILNQGSGPLELIPTSDGCASGARNIRRVLQNVYWDSSGNDQFDRGADGIGTQHEVGCSVFHPQHHHWHIEDFADYELQDEDGVVVAASTKVSFCVIDIHRLEPGLAGSPASPYYTTCGRTSTLGLSVGWSDEYHATLAGQYVVITGLADGTYCLLSTADPQGHIRESDNTNNSAGRYVTITGSSAVAGGACS